MDYLRRLEVNFGQSHGPLRLAPQEINKRMSNKKNNLFIFFKITKYESVII